MFLFRKMKYEMNLVDLLFIEAKNDNGYKLNRYYNNDYIYN